MKKTDLLAAIFVSVDNAKVPILIGALSTFTKLGYGTNITEIANASGLSKQRVLYHFKNADQVLAILADFWGQTGRQTTLEHLAGINASSPFDKIIGMSDGMFLWMKRFPEMANLTPVLFQAVRANPTIKKSFQASLKTGVDRIFTFLKSDPRCKDEKDESLRQLAQSIHAVMVGTALYVIGQDLWDEIEVYKKVASQAILSLLRFDSKKK